VDSGFVDFLKAFLICLLQLRQGGRHEGWTLDRQTDMLTSNDWPVTGGGWRNWDWREWGREWGDNMGKGFKGLLNTLGAIAAFGFVLFALTLWRPLAAFVVSFLRCADR
jgi:hypothetical protein